MTTSSNTFLENKCLQLTCQAPIPKSTVELTNEVEAHIKVIFLNFPATKSRLEQIKNGQIQCQEFQALAKYTENGWSEYKKYVPEFYKNVHSESASL